MAKNYIIFVVILLGGCSLELTKSLILGFDAPEKNLAHYKVGNPYKINGRWYYPKEEPDYKETGIASWYGSEFHDKLTANGEVFDKNKVSAAHRTLPMPSVVRVTNLENGKSMLVRVNDRGPFAHERIIDLSERAAKKLGIYKKGTAKVRVEFDKKTTAKLFNVENYKTPQYVEEKYIGMARPHEKVKSKKLVEGRYFIQVGAFSVFANAEGVKKKLEDIVAIQIEKIEFPDIVLYRVRLGPFKDEGEADKVLDNVKQHGFGNAIIISD